MEKIEAKKAQTVIMMTTGKSAAATCGLPNAALIKTVVKAAPINTPIQHRPYNINGFQLRQLATALKNRLLKTGMSFQCINAGANQNNADKGTLMAKVSNMAL